MENENILGGLYKDDIGNTSFISGGNKEDNLSIKEVTTSFYNNNNNPHLKTDILVDVFSGSSSNYYPDPHEIDIKPNVLPNSEVVPKKAFSFVKKKPLEETSQTQNDLMNANQLNDMSDTKSLKSLRLNNNIKSGNISVNLEQNEDNDNKSQKNFQMNNNTDNSLSNNKYDKDTILLKKPSLKDNLPTNTITQIIATTSNPEIIKKKCYEEINRSEDSVKDLIIKIHALKIKLTTKEKELTDLSNKSEALHHKENEAIENNDFEAAQDIENQILEIKGKIGKINKNMSDFDKEMIQYREQELIIIRNKTKILEDTFNAFNKLKKNQEYELETFQNTDLNRHKNDNVKIKKMNEKLDFLKTNLESEKTFIDEEEEKITKVIKSQSSGVFEELDELNKNKTVLLDEIDELKKILDKKYSELDFINENIESKNIEIDAIKSNFSHEFNKINSKKKHYEESLNDYLLQEEQHLVMIKIYKNDEDKYEEKMKNIKKNVSDLDSELQNFKTDLNELIEDLDKKEYFLRSENEIISKIHLIEMRTNKTNASRDSNLEDIQNLEINNKRLDADIISMNNRIPTLEEEKKSFVSSKNFKEAGRVSNELKLIHENKAKNAEKIEENKNKISELKIENEKINTDLIRINEGRSLEERELNLTRYEYLLSYKDQLEKVIKSLKSKDFNHKDIEEELDFLTKELRVLEKHDYITEKFKKVEIVVEPKVELLQEKVIEESAELIEEEEKKNKEEPEAEAKEIIGDKNDNESNDQQTPSNKDSNNVCESLEIDHLNSQQEEVDIEEIKLKIEELNQNLQICVEADDYEGAEKIQEEIDLLTAKLN